MKTNLHINLPKKYAKNEPISQETIKKKKKGDGNKKITLVATLVIVCANLTSNAVIFKRLSKELQMYTSLLIDFCNDYRPYLC